MPKLPSRVKAALRIAGVVTLVVTGVLLYLSHLYQEASSRHNATTLCIEAVNNLTRTGVSESTIVNVVRNYTRLYGVSMEVRLYSINGSLIFSYGSYAPPIINVGQVPPSPAGSGGLMILAYGVCQYYGSDFILEVKVGVMVEAIYLFIAGLVSLFLGLALIAAGS